MLPVFRSLGPDDDLIVALVRAGVLDEARGRELHARFRAEIGRTGPLPPSGLSGELSGEVVRPVAEPGTETSTAGQAPGFGSTTSGGAPAGHASTTGGQAAFGSTTGGQAAYGSTTGGGPARPTDVERTVVAGTRVDSMTGSLGHSAGHSGMTSTGGLSGELVIPDELANFVIEGELSRGGMGVVLKARQKNIDLPVALKLMLRVDNETEIERFHLEARVLAGFSHPSIVRLRDYGFDEGRPYLSMDLVEGRPLKQVVEESLRKTGKVPDFEWMARVLIGIADALATCHDKGIVHRDIKPANILVEDATDRGVLVDFGIVKRDPGKTREAYESIASDLTKSGDVVGTPAYMAPEQLEKTEGADELGPKTDVWGLGTTLFFALTGRAPYQGASLVNIYKKLLSEEPPPASSINPDVPKWLDELVSDCLTREIAARPTMAEVRDRLTERVGQIADEAEEDVREDRQRKIAGVFAGLTALLAVALAVIFRPRDELAPKLAWVEAPTIVRSEVATFRAKVADDSPVQVLVVERRGGRDIKQRIKPTESGSIEFEVRATESGTAVRVFAVDASENRSEPLEMTVKLDATPPTVALVAESFMTWDAEVELRGKASEPGCKVRVGELEVATDDERRFVARIPVPAGESRLPVVAIDPAGNESPPREALVRRQPSVLVTADASDKPADVLKTYDTIAAALRDCAPYARILIREGEWSGQMIIDKPVQLVGRARETGAEVRIVQALREGLEVSLSEQWRRSSDVVRLAGLTVVRKGDRVEMPGTAAIQVTAGALIVEDCVIRDVFRQAIGVGNLSAGDELQRPRATIRRCRILRPGRAGIAVIGEADVQVESCEIIGAVENGIELTAKPATLTATDLTIRDCGVHGFVAREGTKITITRGRLTGNFRSGGAGDPLSTITLKDVEILNNVIGARLARKPRRVVEDALADMARRHFDGEVSADRLTPHMHWFRDRCVGTNLTIERSSFNQGGLRIKGDADLENLRVDGNGFHGLNVQSRGSIMVRASVIQNNVGHGVYADMDGGGGVTLIKTEVRDNGKSPINQTPRGCVEIKD